MELLTISNIGKTFTHQARTAGVHRVDLEVGQGELISLLGPSGCGKTTTLRCIAGLEAPDHGRIELDGTVLFADGTMGSRGVAVAPERRGIGMVFQDYALWPHMDVFRNVAFGLQGARRSRVEVADEVERALRSVRLWEHRDKRISQLSGGQQQRVALARALAPRPKVVLFDEPLSNLDTQLRDDLRLEILDLHRQLGLTSIWVTHDQEEALGMSHRVVLMNEGRIEQTGRPPELWAAPATKFAAEFLGATNRLSGTVVTADDQTLALAVDDGPRLYLTTRSPVAAGDRATAFIRTSAIKLIDKPSAGATNVVPAEVIGQTFHGDYSVVTMRLGGTAIKVKVDRLLDPSAAHRFAHLDPSQLIVFRDD
ncbi:ABC transporter ATP-binding protein [Kribbella sp. VKM Ac-2568]|uniref:ABC transporter ATP-binding protein n=1 Tax=Kribbella sp. VKM Ac-2568 TaxID=2512219 RepID=UPI00104B2E5F|nr:ABC transporter ATP-binding protein [Kribbella sp. VKM Ac-2568]TCM36005.1 iron(III) transport system ATP-binding protein/putative spermidine/putrescine transport system ATP-binding protein [Kribbella sp. VKM Ac-2568]